MARFTVLRRPVLCDVADGLPGAPPELALAIHRYRGTISAAPNFAFEMCLSKIDEAALAGLDLSSLRLVANGAEPSAFPPCADLPSDLGRMAFGLRRWRRSTGWPRMRWPLRCRARASRPSSTGSAARRSVEAELRNLRLILRMRWRSSAAASRFPIMRSAWSTMPAGRSASGAKGGLSSAALGNLRLF